MKLTGITVVDGNYVVRINCLGKAFYVGTYGDEADAKFAYDVAALAFFPWRGKKDFHDPARFEQYVGRASELHLIREPKFEALYRFLERVREEFQYVPPRLQPPKEKVAPLARNARRREFRTTAVHLVRGLLAIMDLPGACSRLDLVEASKERLDKHLAAGIEELKALGPEPSAEKEPSGVDIFAPAPEVSWPVVEENLTA